MSKPTFPENPDVTRDDVVNQILSSIAMEELGLSHVINAEGEKIQYVLGTLPGLTGPAATIEDLLNTNESVQRMLESASHNQLFLKSKMQAALSSSEMRGPTGAQGPIPAIQRQAFIRNTAFRQRCCFVLEIEIRIPFIQRRNKIRLVIAYYIVPNGLKTPESQ